MGLKCCVEDPEHDKRQEQQMAGFFGNRRPQPVSNEQQKPPELGVDLDQDTGVWEITEDTPNMCIDVREPLQTRAKRRDPKKLLKDDKYATSQYLKLKNDNGDYYEGYCLEKVPHGWGYRLTKDDEYFEGEFSKSNLVKHIRHIHTDGTVFDGEYKKGRNTYSELLQN